MFCGTVTSWAAQSPQELAALTRCEEVWGGYTRHQQGLACYFTRQVRVRASSSLLTQEVLSPREEERVRVPDEGILTLEGGRN